MHGLLLAVAAGLVGCGEPTSEQTEPHSESRGEDRAHGSGEGSGHAHGAEEEHHEGHAEEIRMTPAMMKEAGVTVESISGGPVGTVVSAPGRIVPTQSGIAHVGTAVAGRIARLFVSEGTRVVRGTPLAEIEAFDIGAIKGEYVSARADVERTMSALARQESLAGEGIGARRMLEDAQAAQVRATATLQAAEARLRAAGIDPKGVGGEGGFSSSIVIRSPIAGVVARRHVALGEYLQPEKDAFEVVNTSLVWIDAQVGAETVGRLRVGDISFIRDRADHRHAGRILFISPTVDPESKTVTVRTEVANPDVHLRPESFVTVEFNGEVRGRAMALPDDAIEQEGGEFHVYREHEPGTFERIPVQVEPVMGGRRVVTAGLSEGDRIAVSGLFYLKSARLRGALQEHHH